MLLMTTDQGDCEQTEMVITLNKFLPMDTINQAYYVQVLKRLHKKIKQKRCEIFVKNSWISACSYRAVYERIFSGKTNNCVETPPYSLKSSV